MPCSMTKGVGLQFDSVCVSRSGRSARKLGDGISLGQSRGAVSIWATMSCSMTKGVGLQFDSVCVSCSGRSARELSDGISLGSGAGGSVDLTYHGLFYDEGRRPTV